jgi:hypothetical protein
MNYCPECNAEYTDEVRTCADCEVPLIPAEEYLRRKKQEELERGSLSREEFVPVKVAENAFEADRIREALEQEGIPVLVRTFLDTAYDGIYVAQKGWGYVEVPESERTRAERIVEDVSSVFPEHPAGGEGEDLEE